jgi:hypothetical protein
MTIENATLLLVLATVFLVFVGALQLVLLRSQGRESRRQTEVFDRQAAAIEKQVQYQTEAISTQQAVVAELQLERADRDPFAIQAVLVQPQRAGQLEVDIFNRRSDRVVNLASIRFEQRGTDVTPSEVGLQVRLGVAKDSHRERWVYRYDARGTEIDVVITGQPLGGPTQTRRFVFRVKADGTLEDLQASASGAAFY